VIMAETTLQSRSVAVGKRAGWKAIGAGILIALCTLPAAAQTKLPNPAVVSIHASGRSTSSCLNIVIVAEGFRASDMPVFRQTVATVADRFLHLNPYAALSGLFNIWAIETTSVEQYIDLPVAVANLYSGKLSNPVLTPRTVDTYFASSWAGDGNVQKYVIFPDLSGMHTHIGQLLPGYSLSKDELVVITYFPESDGQMQRISTTPLLSPPHRVDATFFPHEMGHHFGLNDEDYPWDNVTTGLNHTTNTNLADPNHPWHDLFTPRSVLATIVDWRSWNWDNDTWDLHVVNGNSVIIPGLFQTFPPRTGFGDPNGPLRYRPAYSCLMQHTGGRVWMCAVCAERVARTLYTRAGLSFSTTSFYAYGGKIVIEVPFNTSAAGVQVWANGRLLGDVDRDVHITHWGNVEGVLLADVTPFISPGGPNLIRISGNDKILLDGLVARNQNGARLPLIAVIDLSKAIPDGNTIYGDVYWDLKTKGAVEVSVTPDPNWRILRRHLGRK
jgi:hypothetical protein